MANDGGVRVVADDIIVEILHLLPAKSLARFKSVCKSWYNFIKNPNFITNYIDRSQNRYLAIQDVWYKKVYPLGLFLDESLSVCENIIDNPIISNGFPFDSILEFLGPVNGLYCIRWCWYDFGHFDDEESIALWNPFTTEFRQLNCPFSSSKISPSRSLFMVIGFGSTDEDIKLVCIPDRGLDMYTILLYSLARDCWRQIKSDFDLGGFRFGKLQTTAYLNGSYYWLFEDSEYGVFVFDMTTGVLRNIRILSRYRQGGIDRFSVRNNAIVYFGKRWLGEPLDVYEMKEEGCSNKLFSVMQPFWEPLRFCKDDEFVFREHDDDTLMLYNIHTNKSRKLGIDVGYRILDYKGTLTSVKGGSGLIQVL